MITSIPHATFSAIWIYTSHINIPAALPVLEYAPTNHLHFSHQYPTCPPYLGIYGPNNHLPLSHQQAHHYFTYITRSTQRAQTSWAEADHYSHILPTVKMLSLGCERLSSPPLKKKKKKKKKKKIYRFWIITCTTIWVCYHYYGVFLLIYSSYNTQITTKI